MKPVVIVGAGGHGREALDILCAMNEVAPRFDFLGFIDDGIEPGSTAYPHPYKVLGGLEKIQDLDAAIVIAVGSPSLRRSIVGRLGDFESVDLIHPRALVGSHVSYGVGLIMAAGATVTHAVTLGSHVHLNVSSSISHDCVVGSFVTITPGARLSGGVTLGDDVWMGTNATAIQGVTIRDGVTVGAGAAVIGDLPAGVTAVGVPAHPLRVSE